MLPLRSQRDMQRRPQLTQQTSSPNGIPSAGRWACCLRPCAPASHCRRGEEGGCCVSCSAPRDARGKEAKPPGGEPLSSPPALVRRDQCCSRQRSPLLIEQWEEQGSFAAREAIR